VEMMPKFTLNNAHYFCETADITRPFPSVHSVEDPSWEFVWNRWLAASLRHIGLSSHCPHLLQAQPLMQIYSSHLCPEQPVGLSSDKSYTAAD